MGYKMRHKPESARVKKETQKTETRTCGECARGAWNTENRDWKGCVFFGYCEHSDWGHTKDGRGVFLDINKACEHFVEGRKENGGL